MSRPRSRAESGKEEPRPDEAAPRVPAPGPNPGADPEPPALPSSPQKESPSYIKAFEDEAFLRRDELRPVRLQLELSKPDLIQREEGVHSTLVLFGGSRILEQAEAERRLSLAAKKAREHPEDEYLARLHDVAKRVLAKSKYYDEARRLAYIVSTECQKGGLRDYVICTGGGPGIMEAANRGADDAGAKSIGLNIVLPFEQEPNRYISPELCFQFHYFAIRKMHFLMRARALAAFPGGYGTLDELFETLTLIQTKKITPIPVLLFGKEFWERVIDFEFLAEEGTISPEDVRLFQYVETAEDAWRIIRAYYDELTEPCS
ncbi:MAG TPA: LOG family protein [Planctomycetota bacterium]|nr:LOG family protein [Planctomycetota bacterium]